MWICKSTNLNSRLPDCLFPRISPGPRNSKSCSEILNPSVEFFNHHKDLVNKNISSKENLNHIIVSNYQRDGHGRYKRKWYSEKNKNLLASLPFLVGKELSPRMPIILSLSIFETIKEFVSDHDQLKIKWPNDIYIGEKKIAGILIESVANTSSSAIAPVGISTTS